MKYAPMVDCENPPGDNLSHRICLNLEFHRSDSILNERFNTFLQYGVQIDSMKAEFQAFQMKWVGNRRKQCIDISYGFQGHMSGISYLNCMNELTKIRIEELELLVELN